MWNTLSSGIQMVQEKLALTDTDEETKVGALNYRSESETTEIWTVQLQGVNEPDESRGNQAASTSDESEASKHVESSDTPVKETDELLQLKCALDQAEQQNQLLNRDSQLLKEKEVGWVASGVTLPYATLYLCLQDELQRWKSSSTPASGEVSQLRSLR